jgi:chromosome segregation ATPase
MNNDLEGFGQWRRAVDSRLGTLEARVADEASLRAKMDEDMSNLKVEFRAQRRVLQALHDTQQEHTARFETIEGRLGNVEGRLETIEGRLGNVEGRLTSVEGTLQKAHVGVQAIHDKLDRLIGLN